MKKLIVIFLMLFFSVTAYSQEQPNAPRAQTSIPESARFEIVQSPLVVKWTFLLDKYTGHVSQLVKTSNDEYAWENMMVVDLPKSSSENKVRYQIFASGIVVRHTFLLNIETGRCWVLTTYKDDKTKEEYSGWAPFEK